MAYRVLVDDQEVGGASVTCDQAGATINTAVSGVRGTHTVRLAVVGQVEPASTGFMRVLPEKEALR